MEGRPIKLARTLAKAILYQDKAGVQAYIEHYHPDINETDEYGFNPIIEAAIVNKTDIAWHLIQLGVEVNKADMTGRTALHWAAENNNLELAQLLLQQGADPNAFTLGSQPILAIPYIRQHKKMVDLLLEHGADLTFAKDYINTKMLGHVFNLQGVVDIVTHKNEFIELGYEGYFLEFTLYAIYEALSSFLKHYSARRWRRYFGYLRPILKSLSNAAQLIKYQQYNFDRTSYKQQIYNLLNRDLLMLPLAYEGHAISFIRFNNTWARCDRGEYGRQHGCINLYRLNNIEIATSDFFYQLIYTKQSKEFITEELDRLLDLTPITQIPIDPQITGNCSWANIEASVPTMLYLLMQYDRAFPEFDDQKLKEKALAVYESWVEWYQDRLLTSCIDDFYKGSPARKASKAAVLGAVLLQQCHFRNLRNVSRVNQIVKVLMTPGYRYVLSSYLKAYCTPTMTPGGENLRNLLESCGVDPDSLM